MPYVRGETLRSRLERERQLPTADALLIAREVADALQAETGVGCSLPRGRRLPRSCSRSPRAPW